MPSQAPNKPRAHNGLVWLLLAAGTGGTGYGTYRAESAQHEAERYQDQVQHCHERESDRMWQLLHPEARP